MRGYCEVTASLKDEAENSKCYTRVEVECLYRVMGWICDVRTTHRTREPYNTLSSLYLAIFMKLRPHDINKFEIYRIAVK